VLGAAASNCSSPITARRQAPSQSASNAERVEVIANLCCQTVSARHERGDGRLPTECRSEDVAAAPELLAAQHQAVTHDGGPLLVLGAAGTGKTRVVEDRFCWLVGRGCAPERIAVLAPSLARATALRGRLESALARGYEQLFVLTPVELGASILVSLGGGPDPLESILGPGDRLAMLVERIDELSLQHHDFGGSANALLGGFVRRIDRLKAELIGPEEYVDWAARLEAGDRSEAALEREFAEVYRTHERMLAGRRRPDPACAADRA